MLRHPDADAEAKSAADRYAIEAGVTIAGRFVLDLEQTIKKIQAGPQLYSRVLGDGRYWKTFRTPLSIARRLIGFKILAIAHGKRRPGYWRKRTF